ncbi:hypothetical protein B0H14DRAFT_2556951 [Mycena olivaceomarginata]|nr:hypothetical protein B0H14DRAFT_2556951 [Mycena olivaceomarginata]
METHTCPYCDETRRTMQGLRSHIEQSKVCRQRRYIAYAAESDDDTDSSDDSNEDKNGLEESDAADREIIVDVEEPVGTVSYLSDDEDEPNLSADPPQSNDSPIGLSRERIDPRFIKARYRRAIARWWQGRLMESLVDLASVLTADPMDKATLTAFATVSAEHESLRGDADFLNPMAILEAGRLPAYGSAAAPRLHDAQRVSRANGAIVVPDVSSHCSSTLYCNEVCQRKHWPTHKEDCFPYDKVYVIAMHLSIKLLDHKYIRMHLVSYAIRSIGALHHSHPPYLTALLVFVGLVPIETGPRPQRRICIRNIVTVPFAVLDRETKESYFLGRETLRKACGIPDAPAVAILVTPLLKKKHQRQVQDIILRAPCFESHCFGVGRKVTSDLDELYWSLEDELANDVKNYYELQRTPKQPSNSHKSWRRIASTSACQWNDESMITLEVRKLGRDSLSKQEIGNRLRLRKSNRELEEAKHRRRTHTVADGVLGQLAGQDQSSAFLREGGSQEYGNDGLHLIFRQTIKTKNMLRTPQLTPPGVWGQKLAWEAFIYDIFTRGGTYRTTHRHRRAWKRPRTETHRTPRMKKELKDQWDTAKGKSGKRRKEVAKE